MIKSSFPLPIYRRYIMAKAKEDPKPTPAVEPEINETDGEPIFHADEEEGTDDE